MFTKKSILSSTTIFSLLLCSFLVTPHFFKAHANSTYDNDVLNDGAIGYWRMDYATDEHTDLANSSGSTLSGGGHLNETDSHIQIVAGDYKSDWFGGAMGPSNPDSYATASTVGGTLYSPTTDFSIEAWIHPNIIPTDLAGIAVKSGSYGLAFDGSNLAFFTKKSGANQICEDTTDTISTSNTYHLVGTYDGSNMKFYVNGSLVCTLAATGDIDTNASNLTMGSWDTSSLFYSGEIANVAVYGSALSSTQVSTHYSDGSL